MEGEDRNQCELELWRSPPLVALRMEGEDRNFGVVRRVGVERGSPSVWRARIETIRTVVARDANFVALRMEGEDRNYTIPYYSVLTGTSPSVWRARIETMLWKYLPPSLVSPSVWRARIETWASDGAFDNVLVALRMEGEDRNNPLAEISETTGVALRMEGEDRNSAGKKENVDRVVALRMEGEDRNDPTMI